MRWLVLVLISACAMGGSPKYASVPQSVITAPPPATAGQAAGESESIEATSVHEEARSKVASGVLSLFSGDDGGSSGPPTASPSATPIRPNEATPREQLVVEMWMDMQIDDVTKAVATITERVVAGGGRVVSTNLIGASSAALVIRMPPAKTTELATWIDTLGTTESKRTLATDVSKEMFDHDLALKNLHVTMDRLEVLAKRDLPLADILNVEKEMTRVRGEIERIEGEQRFLADRVQYATINLTLDHQGGPVELAHARVYPGVRFATLTLLDPGTRTRTRYGGGGSLRLGRYLTFDLELFPESNGDSRAVLASLGTALYSDYFGYGKRRFLNPYLGMRLGYGYLSGQNGVLAAGEVGIELYRQPLLLVEAAVRAYVLSHAPSTEAGFEGILGASVPF
ncbi:MAG: DUF4349 domain-containing protein [Kofleriaceae bacterium]